MSKINPIIDLPNHQEERIKQIDIKMVDICDTLEGMVHIIKDNGDKIKDEFSQKLENYQTQIEQGLKN